MLRTQLRDRESGFTLVELLVVIIIIGILAAIAIPVFLNQRKRANDAALKSDMKSVANAVVDADLSPTEFRSLYNKNAVNIWGSEAVSALASPVNWNSQAPTNVPQINVSPGTIMTVQMYHAPVSGWNAHTEGEFCLVGAHTNSNYDYIPGNGGGGAFYDKYLFYDVRQGGLKTMDQLIPAYLDDPTTVSCSGAVKAYVDAHGLS